MLLGISHFLKVGKTAIKHPLAVKCKLCQKLRFISPIFGKFANCEKPE